MHHPSSHTSIASLDSTVRIWATETGQYNVHPCDGMVQVVAIVPTDPHICLAGTAKGTIAVVGGYLYIYARVWVWV